MAKHGWRPKNWEETVKKLCGEFPDPRNVYLVEASADAMLQAIITELTETPTPYISPPPRVEEHHGIPIQR